MTDKLTIICETFNKSRYIPHENIAKKVVYIKINSLKRAPYKLPFLLLKIIRTYFTEDYVAITPLLLSPLVILYYPHSCQTNQDPN
jgi:hypothetical protein